MGVSRTSYYQWLGNQHSIREQEDKEVIKMICKAFKKGRGHYGTRRIRNCLLEEGIRVSRRRIARLMKSEGLACKTKKKFKATTDSKHNNPVAPNLLKCESKAKLA